MAKVVLQLGDDISTDVIYPGRYMATVLPTETPQFAFADETAFNAKLKAKQVDAMLAEMRRLDGLVTHLLEVSRGGAPDLQSAPLDPVVQGVPPLVVRQQVLGDRAELLDAGGREILRELEKEQGRE